MLHKIMFWGCPIISIVSPTECLERLYELVYVIGLHAVQFGNKWMKKIPRTAKIGRGRRPSPNWLSEEFLNSTISKLDKHVVLLLIKSQFL